MSCTEQSQEQLGNSGEWPGEWRQDPQVDGLGAGQRQNWDPQTDGLRVSPIDTDGLGGHQEAGPKGRAGLDSGGVGQKISGEGGTPPEAGQVEAGAAAAQRLQEMPTGK